MHTRSGGWPVTTTSTFPLKTLNPKHDRGQTVDEWLDQAAAEYRESGVDVPVSFRELVPDAAPTERATHLMHPYPAKLLRHIPMLFLSSNVLSSRGSLVLDPFCGSGTVLVEALLHGRRAAGADSNPLARLITRVKTTPIDGKRLERAQRSLLSRLPRVEPVIPEPESLERWFHPHAIKELGRLRASIDRIAAQEVREFYLLCLSACARRVSLADPRISVPVRLRADQYAEDHWLRQKTVDRISYLGRVDVVGEFVAVANANIQRLASIGGLGGPVEIADDARHVSPAVPIGLGGGDVDLVLSSPPYLGAQKYVRASRLSLIWLGLATSDEIPRLARTSIGREHFRKAEFEEPVSSGLPEADAIIDSVREANPQRAHLAATYLNEMRSAIDVMVDSLRPEGRAVIVAGANQLCGKEFPTPKFLRELFHRRGMQTDLALVDAIRSRGLMTRRNRSASLIPNETVFVFSRR